MWTLYLSVFFLSVIQIQQVLSTGCNIVSVSSPSASTLDVRWGSNSDASSYRLEFKVLNSTTISPVRIDVSYQITQKVVQGLRPGRVYEVTLQAFAFFTRLCTDVEITMTVPDVMQTISAEAISSTSIKFEWSSVTGASSYRMTAEDYFSPTTKHTKTFTTLSGQIDGLVPSTLYNCYGYAINSAGSSGKSSIKTVETLMPPPAAVNVASTGKSTAQVTWTPVSDVLRYQVTVTDTDNPSNTPVISDTSATSMDISNLEPCTTYTVGVSSFNSFSVPGETTTVSHSTSIIQSVTTISVDYSCSNSMVTVSWDSVLGADSYRVTAIDSTGVSLDCTSASTSCPITMLSCGETYHVYVTVISNNCNSTSNTTTSFETITCAPVNIQTDHTCSSNVIIFSWDHTNETHHYEATSVDANGIKTTCMTTDNYCYFTNVDCGQFYTFTVFAASSECNSEVSQPKTVQTAPCLPANIQTTDHCLSDKLVMIWDSADGADSYTVEAYGNTDETYNCTTTSTSCEMTGIPCGEHLSIYITASNEVCTTPMTVVTNAQTVPCPPQNISTSVDCSQDSGRVNWTKSNGAIIYVALAQESNGNIHWCFSLGSTCLISTLTCGKNYTISVLATNFLCNSTQSTGFPFRTGPCPPTDIQALRSCDADFTRIEWQNHQPTGLYTARMEDQSGAQLTCTNDAVNFCTISSPPCGKTYNVSVTNSDGNCETTSTSISVDSVPCSPEDVIASVACDTGELTLNWTISHPVENFTAVITGETGHSLHCNSTGTQCTMGGLLCGNSYNVTVSSTTGTCSSPPSTEVTVQTWPCTPTNVTVIKTCSSAPVPVSWAASDGAKYYTVVATSSGGHRTECSTSQTSCSLAGLHCGEVYIIGVSGANDHCTGQLSNTVSLDTEPCVPTNLSIHYNATTAQVMWSAASGASYYSVEAVTDQGSLLCCNSTTTSCLLTGLQCSQIYNVTVMTQNRACNNTVTSESYHLMTEPCPPTNVQANMACEQLTAAVSWDQSDLAVSYVAYFDNQSGHYTSCATTNTQCTVSGLTCGTAYNVWVKALGQEYHSSDSTVVSLTSAPCLPGDIEAVVNCNSDGAAIVSWNTVSGAANFSLTAFVSGSLQTLCTTQQNSCNVTNLACGETYNVSLTASNTECSLTAMMPTNVTTGPCPPQGVAVDLECDSSTAVLFWVEKSDVELYKATAIKASGGEVTKCNSTGSTCDFPSLVCGETYNFSVTAVSQGCCSQVSSTVSIQTEPCQPVITSVQTLCQSEEVQISWSQMAGVVNYSVTVRGNLKYVNAYNTTDTLLSVTLPCGQNYNVTVQGQGNECQSIPSSPAFFKTGPCIPQNVTTYVQCELYMGSVSWGSSDGTETYVAVATGLDGHNHQCISNTTSCTWNHLHCGESYTVVVRATDDNCTSLPSSSSVIHMGPCVPENLVAAVDCSMEAVSLIWDASNGSETYYITAEAENTAAQLMTNVTTAHLLNLACGQNYNLSVIPHSNHCAGTSSEVVLIQTWPCAPSGISVEQNCYSGIALVSWQTSNGSDSYTLSMQSDNGITHTATSVVNHLNVTGLDCGYNFSVSVTASNQQCNVTASENTFLQTVPCVPTNVTVVMDCVNNSALVSWSASRGAAQYSVTAHSSVCNNTSSCQTTNLNCNLDNLTCGSSYTIQVWAMDDICSSVPTLALVLDSAPYPPQNVSAQFSCSSNVMTISWDAVGEADHFLVSATADNGGISESCNTTNTWCSLSNVACGKTFTVHVTSVRDDCHSQSSQTHSILSAPCQPQGISGTIDCVTGSAWITWYAALGVDSYTVSAVGGEDYTANCTTAASNTTCEVEDLACGVHYNFSVTARNSQCESQPSTSVDLHTAPCSLAAITALPQCHSSSILVMWELTEGSAGNTIYTVTAKASDNTTLSCNSTGSSCYLHGAQCDLRYAIIVAASSDQCSSMRSPPYKINMEPCPPQNVMLSSSCEDQSVMVSWTPSSVAETYSVVALVAEGHVHTCNTTSRNCSITDLHCSQQYTVFVTAHHENCSSEASQNETLNTGPCQPSGVSVTFHCNNESAVLSWMPSMDAVEYYGCAQAENGNMLYCYSTSLNCTFEGLDCGTIYNFSVQASDGTCNSSFSDPVQQGAVPCPPNDVEVQLLPMQMMVQVMRFTWTEVSCVDSGYLVRLTGSLLGDSQALFDLSSCWTNVTFFEFPLPCGSSYSATVQSRNGAGISDPSVPLSGLTAPCPPSNAVYTSSPVATISWNASVFASAYTVYDNSTTPMTQLCRVSGLSCSPSNITSSNLVITASNAAGESEETSITTE